MVPALKNAASFRSLYNLMRVALRRLFKCERCFIILYNTELAKLFNTVERGFTQTIRVENESLEIVILDLEKEKENLGQFSSKFMLKHFYTGLVAK